MKQAEKNVEIQETQNESDIAAAKLKLDLAELDLVKYRDGDYIQERDTINGEIKLAQEDRTRADEKLAFTERLVKKGYATQAELEADRLAVTKAKIALAVANKKLEVLENFTYKRNIKETQANAEEYKRELERVKLKAEAALTQYKADFSARTLTFKVEREKYDKLQRQIEVCVIRAPRDGLVVYANQRSGGRGGNSNEALVYEGAKVKERQAIIHLPDVTRMQVAARIHESKIDMVREGLPATIRVDARPGETFHGKVDMVSLVPVSGNWPNFNLKEYVTNIRITDDESKVAALKPGLTAEVEILIDHIEDAIQVPITSVVERGGKYFTWVLEEAGAKRREIKIGRSNEQAMQVLDGVAEGQRVVLTPRTILPKEIALLEEEVPAIAEQPQMTGPNGEKLQLPPAKDDAKGGKKAGGEKRSPGEGGGGAWDPVAFFKRLDKNNDGKLTEDELPEQMKSRLSVADTNGDKAIDADEWQKMPRPNGPGGGGQKGAGRGGAQGAAPRSEAGGA